MISKFINAKVSGTTGKMNKIIHVLIFFLQFKCQLFPFLLCFLITFIAFCENYYKFFLEMCKHIEKHHVHIFYSVINI